MEGLLMDGSFSLLEYGLSLLGSAIFPGGSPLLPTRAPRLIQFASWLAAPGVQSGEGAPFPVPGGGGGGKGGGKRNSFASDVVLTMLYDLKAVSWLFVPFAMFGLGVAMYWHQIRSRSKNLEGRLKAWHWVGLLSAVTIFFVIANNAGAGAGQADVEDSYLDVLGRFGIDSGYLNRYSLSVVMAGGLMLLQLFRVQTRRHHHHGGHHTHRSKHHHH